MLGKAVLQQVAMLQAGAGAGRGGGGSAHSGDFMPVN